MRDGNPRRISSRQRKATEKVLMVFDENVLEMTPNPRCFTGEITQEEMQQAMKQAVEQEMADANAEWAEIVTTVKTQIGRRGIQPLPSVGGRASALK